MRKSLGNSQTLRNAGNAVVRDLRTVLALWRTEPTGPDDRRMASRSPLNPSAAAGLVSAAAPRRALGLEGARLPRAAVVHEQAPPQCRGREFRSCWATGLGRPLLPSGQLVRADLLGIVRGESSSGVPSSLRRRFPTGIGEGRIGYSRVLAAASPAQMREYAVSFGGTLPKVLDHDGLEDAFAEKASVVSYLEAGRWLALTGAD
jgi:hypothetical protein